MNFMKLKPTKSDSSLNWTELELGTTSASACLLIFVKREMSCKTSGRTFLPRWVNSVSYWLPMYSCHTTLRRLWPIRSQNSKVLGTFKRSSSGTLVSATNQMQNWHERAVFQQSAFGRSTAGNVVVATIFIIRFFFFSVFFSPPSRPFLIEGVLGSKNLFSESWLERPQY